MAPEEPDIFKIKIIDTLLPRRGKTNSFSLDDKWLQWEL
jgi:hypothetical protein